MGRARFPSKVLPDILVFGGYLAHFLENVTAGFDFPEAFRLSLEDSLRAFWEGVLNWGFPKMVGFFFLVPLSMPRKRGSLETPM